MSGKKIKNKEELKKALNKASKVIDVKNEKKLQLDKIREEELITLNEWKLIPAIEINIPEFEIPKHFILMAIKGFTRATILTGEGGIGKSYLSLNTVKKELESKEWEYKSGFSTPLSLYKWLYFNRERKLLIADDIEGLFDNPKSVNMLKSALWDIAGKRIIQYDTTSEKAEDVPNLFELKANLIILCNKIPNINDKNISALMSRTIKYEINFSHSQKIKIIKDILNLRIDINEEQKKEVIRIVESKVTVATKNFNIRTMELLIAFIKYNPAKAEMLFDETTETDEDEELVLRLINDGRTVEAQIKEFYLESGKSRATFFRIKKRLNKKCIKVSQKNNVDTDKGGLNS